MIIRLSQAGFVKIVATRRILLEAERNVGEKMGEEALSRLYRLFLEADMELVEETSEADELMWEDLAPRKDLHVLAGAYKGRADVLVSLDRRHILTERVKNGFPIPVRSPGEFLKEIAEWIGNEEGEGRDQGAC